MPRYDPKRIESRWQAHWDEHNTFRTPCEPDSREKLYVLDMFPYPSGDGLHVGHPEGYTATDIVCRYARMNGKNVLHPMGWDAFGLPAEQYAIKTGTHPRVTTERNIDTFRRQLKMLGFSYDWGRELSTTDPAYFRWTQWIFLQLFDTWYDAECEWTGPDGALRIGRGRPIAELPIPDEVQDAGDEAVRRYQDRRRLAYQHEAPVNWCPALGTVLANEEIDSEGKSERGGHPVVRIPLRQWMLRITAYAERLIGELEDLDWTDSIKALQRNWIGRSVGAEVDFFIGAADETDFDAAALRWRNERADGGFPVEPGDDVLRVYTTRPDTLYGATYMVVAPEHPAVERLTTTDHAVAVREYCRKASLKSDLDRTDLAREKTGVFTGSHAVNPVNGERVPVWIADYVLATYGTGAIMAVPGHDYRDWEFALAVELPIIKVVEAPDGYEPTPEEQKLGAAARSQNALPAGLEYPFSGEGTAVNSGDYNGLSTTEFKRTITDKLEAGGLGRAAVNYRLRDWLFSRQHFWGEPFPVWHELDEHGEPTGLMRTDAAADLPIGLPEEFDFKPHDRAAGQQAAGDADSRPEPARPEPPLAEAPDDWLYKTADDGKRLLRETNTMPQWAGSCWYYLRFCDPKNADRFVDAELERYWMPVDLYIGGAEHAVLHLLYSRFWHKVLFDRGLVSSPEPFAKLVNQGMILGEAEQTGYQTEAGEWVGARDVEEQRDEQSGETTRVHAPTGERVTAVSVAADDVEKLGDEFVLKSNPAIVVESRAYKMSKSRGNVINPDDVVDVYGADALRLYEMFMGPLQQMKPWSMAGVEGVFRFLGRAWRMIADDRTDDVELNEHVTDDSPSADQLRILHKTIKAVTEDVEKLSFNTAISRMMEFTNEVGGAESRPRAILEPFVLLLSPFAPHLAEELWNVLGHEETLSYEPWPKYEESLIAESEVEIPVQVNGKLRSKVTVPADADQAAIQEAAESDETIRGHIDGKTVVKTIVVPGRLVNFVVKG